LPYDSTNRSGTMRAMNLLHKLNPTLTSCSEVSHNQAVSNDRS